MLQTITDEMFTLPLPLTRWKLDILAGSWETLPDLMSYYYGASQEYYREMLEERKVEVCTIHSSDDSHYKGERRIVLICPLDRFHPKVIYHEALHIMWHYANNAGLEINYDSQEWQANLLEYIIDHLIVLYHQMKTHEAENSEVGQHIKQLPDYLKGATLTEKLKHYFYDTPIILENGAIIPNRGESGPANTGDTPD